MPIMVWCMLNASAMAGSPLASSLDTKVVVQMSAPRPPYFFGTARAGRPLSL